MTEDRQSAQPFPSPEYPPVSVILITKGNHERAGCAIDSVLKGEYPSDKREIIVIEETDAPAPFNQAEGRYIAIPVKNRGFAYARNLGIAQASHPLCAFLDDDCTARTNWLGELVRTIQNNPGAAAVGGAVLVPECGPIGQCENILGFPGGGIKYVHEACGKVVTRQTFSTCNALVQKQSLLNAGGFNKRCTLGNEDEMLARLLGRFHTILYNPHAVVYHAPRDSWTKVFRWFVRRGIAKQAVTGLSPTANKETALLLKNSPLLRATAIFLLLLLFCIPILPAFLLLGALYYAAVLWRFRWSRIYYPALRTFLHIPFVKLTMDIGYDLGLLTALLYRRHRRVRKHD